MNQASVINVTAEERIRRRLAECEVAVIIPCYNEERTIAKVVRDFRRELPTATIYVFDNNSTDRTVAEARNAGAIVGHEPRQGKGYVVQAMFEQVDADVYVMVDGDDTYPAEAVHQVIEPVLQGKADTVVGSRLHAGSNSRFRCLNWFGNKLFLGLFKLAFGVKLTDMLSGYRAFSRHFVKSITLLEGGFEVETELTIACVEKEFTVVEVPVDLRARPEGSHSKIRPLRDGIQIIGTVLALFRDYRPLACFGSLGLLLMIAGFIPGAIVIDEYLRTGLVLHIPSAILAIGLVLSGMVTIHVGVLLYSISRRFREIDRRLQLIASSRLHAARQDSQARTA